MPAAIAANCVADTSVTVAAADAAAAMVFVLVKDCSVIMRRMKKCGVAKAEQKSVRTTIEVERINALWVTSHAQGDGFTSEETYPYIPFVPSSLLTAANHQQPSQAASDVPRETD